MKNNIKEILQNGESETVEFKHNFGSHVITSINAFANTKGGKVLVGINDDGTIAGIKVGNETIQNWIYPIR